MTENASPSSSNSPSDSLSLTDSSYKHSQVMISNDSSQSAPKKTVRFSLEPQIHLIPSRLVIDTKPKKVRFLKTVFVFSTPSLYELKELVDDLWYKESDLSRFENEAYQVYQEFKNKIESRQSN